MKSKVEIREAINKLYQECIKDIEKSRQNLDKAKELHEEALFNKDRLVEKFNQYLDL